MTLKERLTAILFLFCFGVFSIIVLFVSAAYQGLDSMKENQKIIAECRSRKLNQFVKDRVCPNSSVIIAYKTDLDSCFKFSNYKTKYSYFYQVYSCFRVSDGLFNKERENCEYCEPSKTFRL